MKDITGTEIQFGDTVALARRGRRQVWIVLMHVVGIDEDKPILHEYRIDGPNSNPPIPQLISHKSKPYRFEGNPGALFIVTRTKEIRNV